MTSTKNNIYARCAHLKTEKPDFHVDEETIKAINGAVRTLPIYEKSIFEHKLARHYSLERNEKIRCCWKSYVDNAHTRVFAPFQFPKNAHLHFKNNVIQYLPNELNHVDNRLKLGVGPGFDHAGTMPIPNDLLMKRGVKLDTTQEKIRNKKEIRKIKRPLKSSKRQ